MVFQKNSDIFNNNKPSPLYPFVKYLSRQAAQRQRRRCTLFRVFAQHHRELPSANKLNNIIRPMLLSNRAIALKSRDWCYAAPETTVVC